MAEIQEKVYDLIISGAGIPGASLAIGAARLGLDVALIDPRLGLINTGDTRTSALMPESIQFLDKLNLWEKIRHGAQPLNAMRLLDDRDEKRDAPTSVLFSQDDGMPLAYNIPNREIARAQMDALVDVDTYFDCSVLSVQEHADQAHVALSCDLTLVGAVCIAADGAKSPVRQALGIGMHAFSDHQVALTARLSHSMPHEGISTEFHRHAGPMTFVPIAGDGHQSALVWCVSETLAEQFSTLDSAAFCRRVQLASQGLIGEIDDVTARGKFPVRPAFARTLSQGPFALIAEAAHTLPPLLAQGLNLSLKDAEVMLDVIAEHGVNINSTGRYASKRWADLAARFAISEGMNQFIANAPAPINRLYDAGLSWLSKSPGLRAQAIRLGQRGIQKT